MRIDSYLTDTGVAESRTKAKEMILSGVIYVDGVCCTKPSQEVEHPQIEVRGETLCYVGRGGLKLEEALRQFSVSVQGMTAVDIGASTGGFTQCLLMQGAKKVYAVDAGHGQLHEKLRRDPRVVSMEGVNARMLTQTMLGESCDIAVMDVSFISQSLLYPTVRTLLRENGLLISLIKPQFEVGKAYIGKNGIVRDRKRCVEAMERLVEEAALSGLYCQKIIASPITGGDGNHEFLGLFACGREPIKPMVTADQIKMLVFRKQ